jgi:hypothetical protein
MTRQSWREWTSFVLDSDTVNCGIIIANRTESYMYTYNLFVK